MAKTISTLLLASTAVVASGMRFMAVGDWGASFQGDGGKDCSGSIVEQQASDAVAMGHYAAQNAIESVILLGDNFYGSGIHGDCHNCRFQATFEQIYNATSLNVPFHVIGGNHDHLGNVSAQIEYSKLSKRWDYPDYYYTYTDTFNDMGKNVSVQIVLFDTVLADAVDGFHGPKSDAPGTPIPQDAPSSAEQFAWLEKTLKASTADYLWVGGHYPVWSGCNHGPTEILVDKLKPMLEQYDVTGYMCGHDHCEEYIDEGKGPVYVLTGAGFECCYKASNIDKNPEGSFKFAYWDGECPTGAHCPAKSPNTAFTVFDVTSESMTVKFVDSSGATIFTADPLKPRTKKSLAPPLSSPPFS